MMKHKPTYSIQNYPGSSFTYKITVVCSCGTRMTLTDGTTAPTMPRARKRFKAHTEKALVAA